MIGQILPIARIALIESIRQPVLVIMLMLGALLQVLNTWIVGFTMARSNVPGEVTGDNKMLLDVSLATAFVLGIVLAGFVATSAVSREIENKTILTVVSKPVDRVSVIVGKFLGLAGTMLIASLIYIAMLLFAIRHGIMETAADTVDWPVVVFGVGAVFAAIGLGGIGNYLFGWSFPQTAALSMLPLLWLGYLGVLLIDDEWAFQPFTTDLKPQIVLASACMSMALIVMTALTTAISTRAGQVPTILIGAVVFMLGLLSNHFIGRHVFENEGVAKVAAVRHESGMDVYDFRRDEVWALAAERNDMPVEAFAEQGFDPRLYVTRREVLAMGPVDDPQWREIMLREPGASLTIDLLGPPTVQLEPGDPVYYGASTNGTGLITPAFEPLGPDTPAQENARPAPALVITEVGTNTIEITQVGREALPLERPPLPDDTIYLRPTEINPVALGAWSVIPNMQSFWLIDAITKNQPIPLSHVGLVAAYSLSQIVVFLALAVALFQGRDVG